VNAVNVKEKIEHGMTYLGIEFGSTRIKAVLTDDTCTPIAEGSHTWENRLENGYWTYSLEDIHGGLKSCYADLARDVKERYGTALSTVGAMGISGMMHGYMPFDRGGRLLVPFRTWRNATTEKAAAELTELFGFNIPQRWSIAHLYQAVLNGEEHLPQIAYITTLAGYIHTLLTGERAVGIGEASGVFPVDGKGYNTEYIALMNRRLKEKGFERDISEILPKVKQAGEKGAALTTEGAAFLDPTGMLKAGIPLCPPEGDAGTGMTATNAVLPGTGNISAGTSIFSMLVLDKPLKGAYPEIDVVATPDGSPAAMVHCNNCCSEIDAWAKVFADFAHAAGIKLDKGRLYELIFRGAMEGADDCGGITAYNFLSAEPVAKVDSGRPMYFRTPDSVMSFGNFMRAQIYSAMASLKMGMDILFEKERVRAEQFTGHGGFFKTEGTADKLMASALGVPVSVMKTAGEGGAWGMALLAAYMQRGGGRTLSEWLGGEVFAGMEKKTAYPDGNTAEGFNKFMERYKAGLDAERTLGSTEIQS